MTKKMTKKEMFAVLVEVVRGSEFENRDEAIAFLEHEIELLNRKTAKTGMTKTQKENLVVIETIKAVLADAETAVTISELMKDERLAGYTNQKLSALMRQLVKAEDVVRTEEKGKAYFSLAE